MWQSFRLFVHSFNCMLVCSFVSLFFFFCLFYDFVVCLFDFFVCLLLFLSVWSVSYPVVLSVYLFCSAFGQINSWLWTNWLRPVVEWTKMLWSNRPLATRDRLTFFTDGCRSHPVAVLTGEVLLAGAAQLVPLDTEVPRPITVTYPEEHPVSILHQWRRRVARGWRGDIECHWMSSYLFAFCFSQTQRNRPRYCDADDQARHAKQSEGHGRK